MARTRNYATILYDESAPSNWREILAEQFVPAFISPLHSDDVNPNGEVKKPHYHIMIMFDSVKTVEQASEIFKLIGGVGCEIVKSTRGYARYLCHLDNPDKAQYKPDEVICLCGADYFSVINLVIDKYQAIKEICYFCRENNIYAYSDLLFYCIENRQDWFRVLCDNGTYVVKEFITSEFWKKNNNL